MTWTVSVQVSKFLPVSFEFDSASCGDTLVVVGKDFFEEEPEPEEDIAALAAAAAAQAAQAEKRKLRKEASAAAAGASVLPSSVPEAVVQDAASPVEVHKPQAKQAHVRGKSGQRKKIKEKYRDQGRTV